jgi:pimeloyl-ACP methyl ester carboxylesterase
VKGKGPNPKPLVLTHGWPDSFYRFYKVIPMLTDPASYGGDPAQSFDLVVPSIPGFGFSDRVSLSTERTSDLWVTLMTKVLGYKKFLAAGGDLGSGIATFLGRNHPEKVIAIHLTVVEYPDGSEDWSKMARQSRHLENIQQWWQTEGANMIQSTKPQTLGYALNDSPVGLRGLILKSSIPE